MIDNKLIKSVALTAPTNKAVNIIKSKFRSHLKKLAKIQSDNLSFDDIKQECECTSAGCISRAQAYSYDAALYRLERGSA